MSENPEIFVGIDISKDTLDIGFQPLGHSTTRRGSASRKRLVASLIPCSS